MSLHLSMAFTALGEMSVLIHYSYDNILYSCDMTFFLENFFQSGQLLNTSKFNKVCFTLSPSFVLLSFYLNSLPRYLFFLNIHLFIYLLYALHTFGGQRTTYESKLSLSTMLVPRIKLRSSGLATCSFVPLGHLTNPLYATFACLLVFCSA